MEKKFNILVFNNKEEIAKHALSLVLKVVRENKNPVLSLATGSSPICLYNEMIQAYKDGVVSFKNVTSVNLDEYINLPSDHKQSYKSFMKKNLFNHIDINQDNTHIPNGNAVDLEEECARYSNLVLNLKPHLQLLGIGSNGHIAFNEPYTISEKIEDNKTRVVSLTENTIKDNSRFFKSLDEVPTKAITMGVYEILQAKEIILIATGENKAKACFEMIKNELSVSCPASFLQLHNNVTILLDREAAKLLKSNDLSI